MGATLSRGRGGWSLCFGWLDWLVGWLVGPLVALILILTHSTIYDGLNDVRVISSSLRSSCKVNMWALTFARTGVV